MKLLTAILLSIGLAGFFACSGEKGTISVSVVSAPDSDLLAQIQRLEATFSNADGELAHFEGERDSDGTLLIDISLEADGRVGDLVVEGFDSGGTQIAVGKVGPLPLGAVDATVAVYLAAPMSVAQAPVSLETARSNIGGTAASFGVLLAGGLSASGPVNTVDVYSTYLHSIQQGLGMPNPGSNIALIPGTGGFIYMVGGTDALANPTSNAVAFNTTIAPVGGYRDLSMQASHARTNATATVVGQEQFLISGDPALFLDGFQGTLGAVIGGEELDGPAITLVANGSLQVIFAGQGVTSGAAIFQQGLVTRLSPPPELFRRKHRGVALLDGEALYVGGVLESTGLATTTGVIYSAADQQFRSIELLATARILPAVATTDRYLLIIGGEQDDGSPVGDVEVFDIATLAPVAVIPMVVPRKDTTAHALNNGQVLIAGGTDASGQPIALLELFTPDL